MTVATLLPVTLSTFCNPKMPARPFPQKRTSRPSSLVPEEAVYALAVTSVKCRCCSCPVPHTTEALEFLALGLGCVSGAGDPQVSKNEIEEVSPMKLLKEDELQTNSLGRLPGGLREAPEAPGLPGRVG